MPSLAFSTTKWSLDLATKLIKADMRIHNVEAIEDDMSILFVVNHFTRIETLLLPYVLYKHTGREVWSLASADLFVGRMGQYLESAGALSTKDPDRDKVMVHDLLLGEKPWLIFPEGQMVKDKKVIGPGGEYWVYNTGGRRPPHTGAAALALRTEFYRHKLRCIWESPNKEGLDDVKKHFEVDDVEAVLNKRTIIIPVNVTYYPIRARENAVLKVARAFAKDLSKRAVEELSVEGTILSANTDIDITLGNPIDVQKYLGAPEYSELMACGDDVQKIERDPKSLFNEAAGWLMDHYMTSIYQLVRVNYDHILATVIRHQKTKRFTERAYRNRVFLCVHELVKRGHPKLHGVLRRTFRDVIYEDYSEKFHDFMQLCINEGLIRREGDFFIRNFNLQQGQTEFHQIRIEELTYVIANELEPLTVVTDMIRRIAQMPRQQLSERVRDIFLKEDEEAFEEDYETFKNEDSKDKSVGKPFLFLPDKSFRGGIVLVHGYLAAPLEVRALAEFLRGKGYLVYGVRLKGHGTAPEDLAGAEWEDWYESVNRGYAIVKSYTDDIILGGFSTGGILALLAAARKGRKVESVFSINAPLQLRSYAARLVPTVVTMNSLLKRIRRNSQLWDFVQNDPENPHINYPRNPLHGVRELGFLMETAQKELPNVAAPSYVVQASKDPVVDPVSAQQIFAGLGTEHKELTVLERDRHGIINGDGAKDVYDRVYRFLLWAREHKQTRYPLDHIEEDSSAQTA